MDEFVRLSLPADIADELIEDGTAVRAFVTRGTALDAIGIAVDSINTASAAVSVAVAIATCRRLAQAFVRRRHTTEHPASLTIVVDGEKRTIKVDLNRPDATDTLFDFFVTNLDAR